MRVTEAAEKFGFEDAAALAAYLMHSEDGKTAIINMSMSQDDIDTVARLPWSNIISDAIYAKTDTPTPACSVLSPRCCGSMWPSAASTRCRSHPPDDQPARRKNGIGRTRELAERQLC